MDYAFLVPTGKGGLIPDPQNDFNTVGSNLLRACPPDSTSAQHMLLLLDYEVRGPR